MRATREDQAIAPAAGGLRVGIFGSALDTGNLGVSALGVSTVRGLQSGSSPVDCTLFDYGRGTRSVALSDGDDWRTSVRLMGVACSRRYYRLGNLQQLLWSARSGLRGLHPVLRELGRLDAILDIGGGDSFSDIYGQERFDAVAAPKELALALGVPLVLLPQTYGPYRAEANRARAGELVVASRQAWARDPHSLDVARDLVGAASVDLRQGVDVAFGLPAQRPEEPEVHAVLERARARGGAVLGVNLSGLLYNTPGEDRARFHLRDDYRELVDLLLARLLDDAHATVLLVPHVVSPCTAAESDIAACRAARARLAPELAARVEIVPELGDPMQAKWVIGRCDWFSGMRMHACIAGLSQGVPTVAIAYSDKSQGVFETAGASDRVVDPRVLGAREVVDRVVATIAEREGMREALADQASAVHAQWRHEFEAIRGAIEPARSEAA